jgi:hypothetical protein
MELLLINQMIPMSLQTDQYYVHTDRPTDEIRILHKDGIENSIYEERPIRTHSHR